MNTNPTPYALGSEDGEALWFFGMLVTMKATAEQTGGEFLLIEELAPRGTATPLHVHPTDDESLLYPRRRDDVLPRRWPTPPGLSRLVRLHTQRVRPACFPGGLRDRAVSCPHQASARTLYPRCW